MATKLAFFEVRPEESERLLHDIMDDVIYSTPDTLSRETASAANDAEVISVFINSHIDADVLAELPNLRLIITRSTGFDHIDLAAAKERGVVVTNVPAYGSRTVAEFAFALILSLSRRMIEARDRLMKSHSFALDELEGFDLAGKTLGVIGTGKIGKNAIRIANGFGMRVLAFDMYPDEAFATEAGYTYVSLQNLLAQADIVTIHAPSTPETHHMLDAAAFAQMKQGAYLVNTSRGDLIDNEALLMAIKTGRIAGAGLDVIEFERALTKPAAEDDLAPIVAGKALLAHPHVIATPHVAFFSREAVGEIHKTTIDNIRAFEAGAPQNVVS